MEGMEDRRKEGREEEAGKEGKKEERKEGMSFKWSSDRGSSM